MAALSENLRGLFSPEGIKALLCWTYKNLSSIKTSEYILGATAFFYIIGTIFPQGGNLDEYIKAGGKYIFFVRVFGLLELFSSPLFLLAALALFANLVICTYERYPTLFQRPNGAQSFKPRHTIYLTQGITNAIVETRNILKDSLGFKLISKDSEWIIMEKGLPYRALTWVYHAGIAVCFIGFGLSYLFAYEDVITLWPGVPARIAPKSTGKVQGLFTDNAPEGKFSLVLDEFSTEYLTAARLDYPKDKLSRFAIGLGWKRPEYKLKDDSLIVRDWRSRLRVIEDGRTAVEKTIEVNDPLKYNGYTFYQMGYEQKLKLRVDDNPLPLEAKIDTEFFIPGGDAPLKFNELRTGTLYKPDGTKEEFTPYTMVRFSHKAEGASKDDLVKLSLNSAVQVDGRILTLVDFEEGSQLSYRYDPGALVLWWAGIAALIAMFLRFYGYWYTVAYRVEESEGIVFLDINISSKGIFADEKKLVARLERLLTRNDIRPPAIPPVS
ncbi:MAG: cytochrome c biogenesis protein ResB [Deltaproteobacteria bacterium]|nr:cytochrome c biogenesis protein ResB [Deltaproteobacteria bacterium]